jgi:hypothetical protein
LQFFKYKDFFTAFQDISMYLGSIMAIEDTAPYRTGGDAIAIASYGFDEQSFRDIPGQKRLKRKANKERKKQ